MTSSTLKHKRGGTFSYGASFVMPAGTWTPTSQLRDDKNNKIADLTATLTPPVNPGDPSVLLLEKVASSTVTWPIDTLLCDVVFTDTSSPPVVLPTTTFSVEVSDRETQ